MFIHGKTGKKYYSVREKINYYNNVIAGKIDAPTATKRKAKLRLKTLNRINAADYSEPSLIVTNDKHFGNGINKPRACVVIDTDSKGRLLVSSLENRSTKNIVLDKNISRQTGNTRKWIDRSEVYEQKYIFDLKPLTIYDKNKIKSILRKK